jgi:hypothetical protein
MRKIQSGNRKREDVNFQAHIGQSSGLGRDLELVKKIQRTSHFTLPFSRSEMKV